MTSTLNSFKPHHFVLNNFFDKIYCINLDKRPDRWTETQKEFTKANIENVVRFSAIDGSMDVRTGALSSGELGALKSHLEIIKDAQRNQLSNILIFEDDVEFSNTFQRDLNHYFGQLPANWALLYLGGNHISPPSFVSENLLKIHNTVSIHAYAIRNIAFLPIINSLEKAGVPVDVFYTSLQKEYPCYCFYPPLAWQRKDFSDIQKKEAEYEFIKNYLPPITVNYLLKRPGDAIGRFVKKLTAAFKRFF